MTDDARRRFATYEDVDDVSVNPSIAPDFQEVLFRRLTRRGLLAGSLRTAAAGAAAQ